MKRKRLRRQDFIRGRSVGPSTAPLHSAFVCRPFPTQRRNRFPDRRHLGRKSAEAPLHWCSSQPKMSTGLQAPSSLHSSISIPRFGAAAIGAFFSPPGEKIFVPHFTHSLARGASVCVCVYLCNPFMYLLLGSEETRQHWTRLGNVIPNRPVCVVVCRFCVRVCQGGQCFPKGSCPSWF